MATDFFKIGQAAYGGGADVSKAIGEGLEKGRQVFMAYLGEQKAKREKADALTKQYIASIPNVNAIDKIPEWMKGTVNSYLVSEKQKYVDLSRQLSTMSSSDPAYMDTVNALQKIQNNFVNLNDNLNQFQVDHKEYISDADQDIISLGFKEGQADDYTRLTKMYSGGLGLNIKDGQLIFNENGKNYNYSLGQIGGYFKKDSAPQTQLLKLENGLKQQAISGVDFKTAKSGYEGVITQLLNTGGKQGILSMVFDTDVDFITGGKSLQTPEILEAISQDRFKTTIDADGNEIKGANALVKDQLMQGVETLHNNLYKPFEPNAGKPTEGDKKYARDTENILAAADIMYSSGELPSTLPGLTEIPINSKEYVINAELEAQQAAIADGTLDKDDALSPEEISNKYPAPYYTLDLRPIKSIREALTIAYGADQRQIQEVLAKLSNTKDYDASKLLFSNASLSATTANGDKLPSLPPKNEVTQTTQLRGEYAYGKNYLDSIKKLKDEIGYKVFAPRVRAAFAEAAGQTPKVVERNEKIKQMKELMDALKRDFPNLDLSDIKIPTPQDI